MQRVVVSALSAVVVALLVWPAAAQNNGSGESRIGGAKGWDAYAYTEKGAKVCYLFGAPEKKEPANLSRGRVDVYVTHRPAEKAVNVVHFDAGYPYKDGATAELEIDKAKFTLFTSKDAAWANDAAEDKAVTEALGKGHRAILKGTSARGTTTTDTYSLDGFKDALAAIDKACGVKR
jgi:hypothetical protein